MAFERTIQLEQVRLSRSIKRGEEFGRLISGQLIEGGQSPYTNAEPISTSELWRKIAAYGCLSFQRRMRFFTILRNQEAAGLAVSIPGQRLSPAVDTDRSYYATLVNYWLAGEAQEDWLVHRNIGEALVAETARVAPTVIGYRDAHTRLVGSHAAISPSSSRHCVMALIPAAIEEGSEMKIPYGLMMHLAPTDNIGEIVSGFENVPGLSQDEGNLQLYYSEFPYKKST